MPPDRGLEVAFAGRSNAGKSSVINAIVGVTRLARTSKTPGCTQQINFFALMHERRLVDLPGYGYARVPDSIARRWQSLLSRYLESRRSLKGLMLVMDIRHPLTPLDLQILEWCERSDLAAHLLLNKADKLSRGAAQHVLQQVRERVQEHHATVTAQLFSARLKSGVEETRTTLEAWLDLGGKKSPS
jgi:GTP-binding protein